MSAPDASQAPGTTDQENAAWIFGARPATVVGGGLLLLLLAAALLAIGQRDDTGTIVMLSFCAAPLGLLVLLIGIARYIASAAGKGGEGGEGRRFAERGEGAPRYSSMGPEAPCLFLVALTAAGMAPGSWAVSPTAEPSWPISRKAPVSAASATSLSRDRRAASGSG